MAKKEKVKKPWYVRLIISLISTVLVLALIWGGICIFVKVKYDISVFQTINCVNKLSQDVNEETAFPNKFSASDMSSAMTDVNAKIAGLITYTEADGYDVTGKGVTSETHLVSTLKITDKQLGAITDVIIRSQADKATTQLFGHDVTLELVQIKFDNINNTTGEADVNIVVKFDISFLRKEMNSFPLSLFANKIPSVMYVSSTNTISKGEGAFEYSVVPKEFAINNLSNSETQDLFKVINLVASAGSAEDMNKQIGTMFANLLIGNSESNGFAYSLKDFGVADYSFETNTATGDNYFVFLA